LALSLSLHLHWHLLLLLLLLGRLLLHRHPSLPLSCSLRLHLPLHLPKTLLHLTILCTGPRLYLILPLHLSLSLTLDLTLYVRLRLPRWLSCTRTLARRLHVLLLQTLLPFFGLYLHKPLPKYHLLRLHR
jgi:hypothetical protein